MTGYSTYTRTDKIRARKVTADEGEQVVSSTGVVHAPKGSYVTERENADGVTVNDVQDAETFEAEWGKKKSAKKRTAKKSAAKKSTPASPKNDDAVARARARAAAKKS